MSGDPAGPASLARLLGEAGAALEAGDPEAAARAIAGALERIAAGPAPADPEGLRAIQSRLWGLAEREAARVSRELSALGSSRRAAGAYRAG